MTKFWLFTVCALFVLPVQARAQGTQGASTMLPGFHRSPWFGEQVREEWLEPNVRVVLNAPGNFDPALPTHLVIFALPNGNNIEQSLGSALATGTDWHYDIQHIAAQTRRLRELSPGQNIVLAAIEADTLSWPAWRAAHPDNAALIRGFVATLRQQVGGDKSIPVTLICHSGGGSFIWGFLNGGAAIPDFVERIALLDANYSYSDGDEHHGDKFLAWLKADVSRHLVVIAYDDRNITIDGKKVIGDDGGTFRASERMRKRFRLDETLTDSTDGDVVTTQAMNGQILFRVHSNSQNKILHTVLVGEMNGFLAAMTHGTPNATTWGTFGVGPRAYTQWVQPVAAIPARPGDAMGGAAFLKQIVDLAPAAREAAIATEICRGNIPNFLRSFQPVKATLADKDGKEHTATYEVMPDYLAVGSDTDFVRLPMTPQTAQQIADAFGCSLPTRKMVNDIYAQSSVKLEPRPLTEAREAVATFAQHNAIVETQRQGQVLGALVAGHQKDIVVTNRLGEKPGRVAIYGWHQLGGTPIQPLTTVHKDFYVDYSHGVRLVKRRVVVDGKPVDLHAALHNAGQSPLFGDEGPVVFPSY